MSMIIVQLDNTLFGVYDSHRVGPYNTPLLFKGSLDECLEFRTNN